MELSQTTGYPRLARQNGGHVVLDVAGYSGLRLMRPRLSFSLLTVLIATGCVTPPPPPLDMRPYPGFLKRRAHEAGAAENAAAVRAGYMSAKIANGRVYYCRPQQLIQTNIIWDVCDPKPDEQQPGKREPDAHAQHEWLERDGTDWMIEVCALPPEKKAKQIELAHKRGFALYCADESAPPNEAPQ